MHTDTTGDMRHLNQTALKPSFNPAGVEPGNQEGPGCYGVAAVSRIDRSIGLFCRISSLL